MKYENYIILVSIADTNYLSKLKAGDLKGVVIKASSTFNAYKAAAFQYSEFANPLYIRSEILGCCEDQDDEHRQAENYSIIIAEQRAP